MSIDVSEQKPTSGSTFEELIDDLLQAHTDYERAESWQVRRAREDYLVEKVKVVTVLQLLGEQRAVLLEALQKCVQFFSDGDDEDWSCIKQARAAIAKATGSTL